MFRRACFTAAVVSTAWLMTVYSANANLVAYWDFDSDFGADVGGPTYDATASNGASISNVQSKFGGGSAHFSKALSQYAATTASPVAAGTFSYSLWVYLDVEQTGPDPDRQFAPLNNANPASEPSLFINIDGDGAAAPGNDDDLLVIRALTDGGGLGQAFVIHNFDNPTVHREWKNIIGTVEYDSVGDMTTLSAYLNGSLVGAQTAAGKPEASTHLVFGADRDLAARFWEGYIDDVAIYDHVLSADEIAGLQRAPAVVPEPSSIAIVAIGLIALLPRLYKSRL